MEDIVYATSNSGIRDNHSIAYCLLGYLCAYYRYYYPVEFLTAFLNNAANSDDINSGTKYAAILGITMTLPKWGFSKSDYFFDKQKHIIAKGLSSIKYIGNGLAEELYDIAHASQHDHFVDVLTDINRYTSCDSRQVDMLIKIGFFDVFGNQRELLRVCDIFYFNFKRGAAKKIRREDVDSSPFGKIIAKYAIGETKSGEPAKMYTLTDVQAIMREIEDSVLAVKMDDLDTLVKIRNFYDIMGYYGYESGREEDRKKLFVLDVYPLKRKKDGKQFGYSVITKSIGSGKEARFTVFNRAFEKEPIKSGDIIYCERFVREGPYFTMTAYHREW